jgi:hypothetical protein
MADTPRPCVARLPSRETLQEDMLPLAKRAARQGTYQLWAQVPGVGFPFALAGARRRGASPPPPSPPWVWLAASQPATRACKPVYRIARRLLGYSRYLRWLHGTVVCLFKCPLCILKPTENWTALHLSPGSLYDVRVRPAPVQLLLFYCSFFALAHFAPDFRP